MQIKDILYVALLFIAITLVLGFGAQILGNIQGNSVSGTGGSFSSTINNRSYTFTGGVATLSGATLEGFGNLVVNSINNFTNNTISSTNYYLNGSNGNSGTLGTITLRTGMTQIGAQGANPILNVTYTFTANTLTGQYNITGYGLQSLNTFGSWLPMLALVIIAAIVIGIIFAYFLFNKKQ